MTDARSDVRQFRIGVSDAETDDLHRRLDVIWWPRHVVAGWAEGKPPEYVRSLLHTWRHEFDCRNPEASLNAFPQVVVELNGIDVHAIHRPGVGPAPVPLVMSHGWPSTSPSGAR